MLRNIQQTNKLQIPAATSLDEQLYHENKKMHSFKMNNKKFNPL